jgi:hypothetical protein
MARLFKSAAGMGQLSSRYARLGLAHTGDLQNRRYTNETGGPQRDDSVQSLTSPRVDLSTRSIGDDLLGGSFLSAWRGKE